MSSNTSKDEAFESRLPAGGASFLSTHQEMFRELYKLEPDECLCSIARELRKALNCETVCILLWNEGRQKLITEYESGMPEALVRVEHGDGRPRRVVRAEEYGPNEGVTGLTIFTKNRLVRCLVDMGSRRIDDLQTGTRIDDASTNWHNIEAFAHNSAKGGFRSLLGTPFSVRSQKLGVVKLINKLDVAGRIHEDGFNEEDTRTLAYFLDAIEHVVEIKRNEKQVQSLLQVGQKIIGSAFGYEEVLKEIVARCADALNYRVCLIRLMDDGRLAVRASNVPIPGREESNARYTPYITAIQLEKPLKGIFQEDRGGISRLQLQSAEKCKKIRFDKLSSRFARFLHHYGLTSFLIIPIIRRGHVIGTIECYTSLPREFSAQELNSIRLYVDALIITSINDKQQLLLTKLTELQRIGAVSDEVAGREENVILGVLGRSRELLGHRLKLLGVIFSRSRIARSKLACKELYGASRKEFTDALGTAEFQAILDQLNGPYKHGGGPPYAPGTIETHLVAVGRRALNMIRIPISPENDGGPLGVFVLVMHQSNGEDEFAQQVVQLAAGYLSVMLSNIEEFRRSKELLRIIDDAPLKDTLSDMYKFILQQTTDFFGFDYGAISKVDHIGRRVETVMAYSAKPDLVDPTEWMNLSSYRLDEYDILTDVIERKKEVIINAAGPGEEHDPRLNMMIYARFNHQDLARIWVPFVFRHAESGSEQRDLVLGIIEAGYHRQTQERIGQQKRDLFVLFVDSCAKSLQRVSLLEERQSIEDIRGKFNQEANPDELLRMLLEESVNLVRGDWGNITFLTHYDQKIRFIDAISYKMPPMQPGRLVEELDVGAEGRTGIIGYVAWKGEPYWSNDVKKDNKYVEECPKVRSELAVPLRFSGRVIGVLDINSNRKDWFDERKASLVQSVAEHATGLYQNARVREPLYKLISPFNPFASTEEIYRQVVRIIEGYLRTETVSVWRRHPVGDSFELELVAASDGLYERYREANLLTLPPSSFTGKAATGVDEIYVNEQEIRKGFTNPEFAKANGLRSMTAVPIRVGDEIHGAIDVFSRRDTKLFPEEVLVLRILASKAAIALQSATLVQSFNDIANIAPHEDIDSILRRIASRALDILKAEPVILFRYNANQFDPEAIVAGKLLYNNVRIVTNENDMANMVLKLEDPLYLKSEKDYLAFEREVGRKWHSDRLPADFWHREKIKSLAALKLKHRDEIVGVMFINYREPQVFSESVERLIKVFSSQAAAAIYNAKITEQNKEFWETKRGDSLSLTVSEVVFSLAHNSGHLLGEVADSFGKIEKILGKGKVSEGQWKKLQEHVESAKGPMDALQEDFQELKSYRRLREIRLEEHDINSVVRKAINWLRDTFRRQRVIVDEKYAPSNPTVLCDENQIRHVLLNLFLNAIEAMEHKGKLSITTSINKSTGEVEVRVSDNGPGIPRDLRDKLFEPGFSTKKQKIGTGFGLPISRYILIEHGGRIEVGPSSTKGATFYIYLRVNN